MRATIYALCSLLLLPLFSAHSSAIQAQSVKGVDLIQLLGQTSANSLSGAIRGYILELIPEKLYEKKMDWGRQKMVARGIKWKGLKPTIMKNPKNHGVWQKVAVYAPNLRNTLVFDIRNVRQTSPGVASFDIFISFDTRTFYDRQNWRSGIRLIAGSIRARARVRALLHCQLISRTIKKPGQFVPDMVFQFRTLKANVGYDQFQVEHVYGMGGEFAQLFGSAAKSMIEQFRPSLERDMINKANSAIVKAASTKEVRVNFSKLFESLSP